MVRPINKKAEEGEKAIQRAIEGFKKGLSQSVNHAANECGVPVNYLHNLVIGSSGGFSLYSSGLQSLETCRQWNWRTLCFKEPKHWCR